MELSAKRRKKIFLLFFFGIGLPSLLLGYFAFRGIQNDQALLEKRRLDDHRRASEQVTSFIDQSISEMEQAFVKTLSDLYDSGDQDFIRPLKDFKYRYPLIEEVFLFRNADEINFPAADLLFYPEGSLINTSVSLKRSSRKPNFLKAQQSEFRQKNYQQALSSYQRAMGQADDRQLKGECLNAIARVQKKANLFEEAIESYKKISEEYSQIRITDGIPLGLAARMELGLLYRETGDIPSAIKTHIELYRFLIDREWRLENGAYGYFSQNVNNCIQDIFSQKSLPSEITSFKDTYQDLLKEGQARKEQTERLLIFQQRAATDIQAKMPPSIGDS